MWPQGWAGLVAGTAAGVAILFIINPFYGGSPNKQEMQARVRLLSAEAQFALAIAAGRKQPNESFPDDQRTDASRAENSPELSA
jgi:hypothetical protein